jgi:hypothetical protein
MTATDAPPLPSPAPGDRGMSHREVLEAPSGLLPAMFVAILSSTVVTTALPRIIGDLGDSRSAYTWVVSSIPMLIGLFISSTVVGRLVTWTVGGKSGIDISRERAHSTDQGATP